VKENAEMLVMDLAGRMQSAHHLSTEPFAPVRSRHLETHSKNASCSNALRVVTAILQKPVSITNALIPALWRMSVELIPNVHLKIIKQFVLAKLSILEILCWDVFL
jgi:hypothetical protein